jgi:hypothetical protein
MMSTYQAVDLFEYTFKQGWWHRVGAILRGQRTKLLHLATVVGGRPINAHPCIGTQTVPIRQIRGSETLREAFDDAFHPLDTHTRGTWLSIANAWLRGKALQPVKLIRLGDVYFVRDGHHHISVARALGQQEIDAFVTVWEVATPANPERNRA